MRPLDEIERGASAAADGPWDVDPFEYNEDGERLYFPSVRVEPRRPTDYDPEGRMRGRIVINEPSPSSMDTFDATALFIANARQDVPDLVARVRELEGTIRAAIADLSRRDREPRVIDALLAGLRGVEA